MASNGNDPNGRRWWHRALTCVLALALVASACSSGDDDEREGADPTPASGSGASDDVILVADLGSGEPRPVRLSEGQPSVVEPDSVPVVAGEPLSDGEVEAIRNRLPDWSEEPDDAVEFNRPPESLPPPRPGETIDNTFPESLDTDPPDDVAAGPLEVLRVQPQGDVDIAPVVSITFNQPMVPIGTLDQLDELAVPVVMTPELPGRWEWIGTRTLQFVHDSDVIDRLPMATAYSVEIPAGTRSQSGGVLADDVQFEFTTPAVRVLDLVPATGIDEDSGAGIALEPVFVAVFDQLIEPAAVLETITVEADGDAVAVRAATPDEIEADELATRIVESSPEGRVLAFRAVEPFEPDSPIVITVGPGTPSAEGPLSSDDAATFRTRTFEPLEIDWQSCRGDDVCRPFSSLAVEFNNALDQELFDPSTIGIEPEIPGVFVNSAGNRIWIDGATQGSTDYEVTLPADLTDVWGQRLGEEETLTFEIGPAGPLLAEFPGDIITVDPYLDRPTVGVATVNHDRIRVQAFAVDPGEWERYIDSRYQVGDPDFELPRWEEVLDREVDIDADDDALVETAIDLSDALDGDHGQLIVLVTPDREFDPADEDYWSNRPAMVWVQVTDIGLDAFSDPHRVVAWTTDLATGAPLADVTVELSQTSVTMTTDADGLATAELPVRAAPMVIATKGDDVAILPNWWAERVQGRDTVRWYVIDDRGMYRPGETVNIKGWARRLTLSDDAQLAPIDASSVEYSVMDPQGNELDSGSAGLSVLGGFDFSVDLPDNANLGWAWIDLRLSGTGASPDQYGHGFQIQEFRRPEFEVTARTESEGPYLQTEGATVAVDAEYFSGGPLPGADVNWLVTSAEATYDPPNWPDFTFGIWKPWWFETFHGDIGVAADVAVDMAAEEEFFPEPPGFPGGETRVEEFSGVTDAGGSHYLDIEFGGDTTDLPMSVTAAATVFDVNRQAWSSSTAVLVHPGELYVGLRSDVTFVRQGSPLPISAVVTDIDGAAVPGRSLTVEAHRIEWQTVKGVWQETVADTQSCEVTTADEPVTCEFTTELGGEYRITSTVVDDQDRPNRSELTVWVSGGRTRPDRRLLQQEVVLVPDQQEYQPGDEAEILVQAPFESGEGLLTLGRNGIEQTERFQFQDASAILTVPIDDEDIPNINVQVDLVGATERLTDDGDPLPDAPPRPAYATARLSLAVPPMTRTLSVEAVPGADELPPGAETTIDVEVLDEDGEPVEGAEMAVIVVDEAVLALTDYQLTDPIGVFYSPIEALIRSQYLRQTVVLENPLAFGEGDARLATAGVAEEAAEEMADFESDDDAGADGAGEAALAPTDPAVGGQVPIDVRTEFDALAVFEPEVLTDAAGTAEISVSLPDNLTRYRVMVVAVDGVDRFGSSESNITARLPLQVRPSPPRFLNFGDDFEFPVVVQNQTDEPMDVEVVVDTSNLDITSASGLRVTVPANDRVEVRFPASAREAGTARYRVAAVTSDAADAAESSLPVYTPATSEAFATYGVVDDQGSVLQPLLTPEDVWPQFGGLEIDTSSTALQALTDALIYVADYEYDSADALASRILAIAALRDVMEAFDAEGLPSDAELDEVVSQDLEALAALQNEDGGFPIWRRWEPSWSYHSVHVAHALVEADNAGYEVPRDTLDRALQYLRSVEDRFWPEDMSQETRDTVSAYALHVRRLAGDVDGAKAEGLYDRRGDELSLEATAWLWPLIDDAVMTSEIERTFSNRATETAGAATFAETYGDDAYVILHSTRRTDAVILDALILQEPTSDLIPKVVAGLLGNQTRGRWDNMQENTFVLLALNNYFDTFESVDPDFVARVWLGDLYAAEHEYRGRTTVRNQTVVPMAELVADDAGDLLVAKDGADGRLYYRLGLDYAPRDLDLDPRDRGFVVDRTYEAIDDPEDVSRDADGTWRVRAGAQVRVKLAMVADSRRTHVALVDPLPAGLEPVNAALAVSPPIPPEDDAELITYPYWQWFEHQNLRDDRAEAFSSFLPAGVYEYTYVARATTPGTFVTPPARAEQMYEPETFGRSGTDFVVVD